MIVCEGAQNKKIVPTESQEQKVVVQWLRWNKILFYHVPNGGERNIWTARNLKAEGVEAGVPDLCLPIGSACGRYHGLYIELKRVSGGSLSERQRWWLEQLNKNGYLAVVCQGAEETIRVIQDYLRLPKEVA